jgi:diguanylate cyclase (GGDEF)-like protein
MKRFYLALNLRTKIAGLASLLVMAAVLSLTLISIQREKSNFKRELEDQANLLLRTLPLTMWDHISHNQIDELLALSEIINDAENITQFVIFESTGEILVDSKGDAENLTIELATLGKTVLDTAQDKIYTSWQTNQLIACRPIRHNSENIGAVLIGLSTEPLDKKISTITQQGILLAMIASIIGAGFSYLLGFQISHPLMKLAEIAAQMADGDLYIRSNPKSQDEIGQLGTAFNRMVTAIQSREGDLRDLTNSLEHAVIERTTELQEKNEALKRIAITDELTKIFNRRHFFELAEVEIERTRRYNHPVSVVLIDADHFKNINDSYGHLVGDQILVNLANFLEGNIRRIDIHARYGGEEFIVLMPETDCEDAAISAERIRKLVESTPMTKGGVDVRITISIGIACWDGNGEMSLDSLLAHADFALYQSKESGRNLVSIWHNDQ